MCSGGSLLIAHIARIEQALAEAGQDRSGPNLAILHSCVGIILFGVPNQGLRNENLLSLTRGKRSEPFVHNLGEGSELLEMIDVAFRRCYERDLDPCPIAYFFEARDTKTAVSFILTSSTTECI